MSLISVEDALALVMQGVGPVARTETVALRDARDRVLAGDLLALRTQPGFDASAMDGYALRSVDGAAQRRLIGEAAAGKAFDGAVNQGETVRIFTGAPVPSGADSILIQENAERQGESGVLPLEPVVAGRHIRKAGADFFAQDRLLPNGTRLGPGAVALAASGGHAGLRVVARPKVAVLATGDELVLPGQSLGPSQIVASNLFGIAAMVESAGGEVLDYGIASDDITEIGARLDRALEDGIDIFVTIGGASVGDHDLVGAVFADKGIALDFWKVAMRPGKPLMAGRIGATRLIGLPGNPASSMVAATLFLKPLVEALAGRAPTSAYRRGVLGADMPENDSRADFIRSGIDESDPSRPVILPLGRQDSSLLSIYARAKVLLLREPLAKPAKTGEPCRYLVLD